MRISTESRTSIESGIVTDVCPIHSDLSILTIQNLYPEAPYLKINFYGELNKARLLARAVDLVSEVRGLFFKTITQEIRTSDGLAYSTTILLKTARHYDQTVRVLDGFKLIAPKDFQRKV